MADSLVAHLGECHIILCGWLASQSTIIETTELFHNLTHEHNSLYSNPLAFHIAAPEAESTLSLCSSTYRDHLLALRLQKHQT